MSDADVVIVGAGVAGLVIAHDLARAGHRVQALEASDRPGGLLRRGTVAGVDLDLGAESFATRTDAVAELLADAELDLELVEPRPGGAFLAVATGAGPVRAPLPRRTVLGIPADPAAPDVVTIIGEDAAARAAQEWTMPPAALDEEPSLFDLVAQRCGPVVAERLVDTLCRSVYSRPATEVRLSALHPELWRAFAAHGSLTRAAADVAQASRAGAAVGGISGGMWRLPAALADAAARHGADIRTGVVVDRIAEDDGALVVHTRTGAFSARRVVVATGPAAADRLLGVAAAAVGAADPAPAGRVRVVAAAIDHAGLDGFPVGSGVIVDPALPTAAKALTHVTAKWAWADASTPAGRHLVRLSARDAPAPNTAPTTAPTVATASDVAREVALLTGVDVTPVDVVDVVVQDWTDAVSAGSPDAASRRAVIAAADARGIHHAGAAAAGTGLAAVVPHARALAARLTAELSRTSPAFSTRSTA